MQERYRVFDEAMSRFNAHLGGIYRCRRWRADALNLCNL